MKKKLISIILLLCIVVGGLGGAPAKKAGAGSQKAVYVAIGDSIAAGYGLEGYAGQQTDMPADSYPSLVGKFLHTKPVNGAVSGITLQDGIDMISTGSLDDALKNADVITVSLGSNDLLQPFLQSLGATFQLDSSTITESDSEEITDKVFAYYKAYGALGLLAKMKEFEEALAGNDELEENMASFDARYDKLLALLEAKKSSDAQIYLTNIYHPYSEIAGLSEIIEPYIRKVNGIISRKAQKYVLIDVYSVFAKKNETNVHFDLQDTSTVNFDPHPSKNGHATIAGLVIHAIKKANAPAKPVIKKASINKKGKLTINIKKVKHASGYEISYRTSPKGKSVKLKSSKKNTATCKIKNFKKKKTYYISVRCYTTKKSVTFYSESSKVVKVK